MKICKKNNYCKFIFLTPNMGAGGAERVVSMLANEFAYNGLDVDVVMLLDGVVQYELIPQINIIDLNTAKVSKGQRILVLRKYLIEESQNNKKLIIIPFHDTCLKSVLLAAIGLQSTIIACERNNPYIKGNSLWKKLRANIPYLLADKCVFQTIEAQEYYCDTVKRKSIFIPNPIKIDPNVSSLNNNSKKIISVGRLEPQKNHELLIKAFAEIQCVYPEYILEIYGEGSLRESLVNLIKELRMEKHVYLKGYSGKIHEKIAAAEIFVLSSDYEGMSNALLEALAIGTPVISTDHPIGGARAIIKNQYNGVLVPVQNKKALADAIIYYIENPVHAKEMGDNGKKIADELNIKEIAKRWLEFV